MRQADGFLPIIDGLSPDQQAELFAALDVEEAGAVDADWESWAHPGQEAPAGDWRSWVLLGGRGFGKTRAGAEWIAGLIRAVAGEEPLRIALVAATIDEARRVMIEGDSGLLVVAGELVDRWYPTRRLLRFVGGTEAVLFSGASPEALRGPQHHYAWCDELAKWEKAQATWDMLQLGLRLGERPRALVTTTPRSGTVLDAIIAERGSVMTGGPMRANPHLPSAFREAVEAKYAGTRLGVQELDGVLLTDAAGALWTVALLEWCRVGADAVPSSVRAEPVEARAFFTERGEGVVSVSPGTCASTSSARTERVGEKSGKGAFSPISIDDRGQALFQRFPQFGGERLSAIDSVRAEPFEARGSSAGPGLGAESGSPAACASTSSARTGEGAPTDQEATLAPPPHFTRTLIAVDPPSGDGTCGIIACARDAVGVAHVLADHSVTARSPEGWARAVAVAAAVHGTREVIAESNQGGKMVRAVLHAADAGLQVRLVTAHQGKTARAEPVACAFEAGKVRLHGRFPELEAQLLGMIAGGDYKGPGGSPDRADAMVWGVGELLRERVEARVREI